jgi:hypothetical protein
MGGSESTLVRRIDSLTVDIRSTIAAVADAVHGAFTAANRPAELCVKFGIKVGGEAGIPYVTSTSGEATLEVSLTWRNTDADAHIVTRASLPSK